MRNHYLFKPHTLDRVWEGRFARGEPMSSSPDSVLFDLGGVLFHYMPERRLERLIEMTSLPGGRIQEEIWESNYDETCERGDLDAVESHAEFCGRLGIDVSYDSFRAAMAYAFEPNACVFELARRVATNHDVAILTNNWQAVEEALVADYPELACIFGQHLYFTWRLKGRKPDQAVFEKALHSWNKEPSQVLFIDDSEKNVTGGTDCGLHTHHFTGAEALENELWSRGLI